MRLLGRIFIGRRLTPMNADKPCVFVGVYRRSSAAICFFLASFLLFACAAWAADLPYFSVLSDDAGAWPEILGSIGLQRQPAGVSRIFVARTGAAASVEWFARVERGAVLILEGESSLADLFGFRRSQKDPVRVQSLSDVHHLSLI